MSSALSSPVLSVNSHKKFVFQPEKSFSFLINVKVLPSSVFFFQSKSLFRPTLISPLCCTRRTTQPSFPPTKLIFAQTFAPNFILNDSSRPTALSFGLLLPEICFQDDFERNYYCPESSNLESYQRGMLLLSLKSSNLRKVQLFHPILQM